MSWDSFPVNQITFWWTASERHISYLFKECRYQLTTPSLHKLFRSLIILTVKKKKKRPLIPQIISAGLEGRAVPLSLYLGSICKVCCNFQLGTSNVVPLMSLKFIEFTLHVTEQTTAPNLILSPAPLKMWFPLQTVSQWTFTKYNILQLAAVPLRIQKR